MPNQEGPLISLGEIEKQEQERTTGGEETRETPRDLESPEPEPETNLPQGQPVPVRTKETPFSTPTPKEIPEEVVETVETENRGGGVFRLERKIPVGEGPSAPVSGQAPEASALAEEVTALRSDSKEG